MCVATEFTQVDLSARLHNHSALGDAVWIDLLIGGDLQNAAHMPFKGVFPALMCTTIVHMQYTACCMQAFLAVSNLLLLTATASGSIGTPASMNHSDKVILPISGYVTFVLCI